MTISNKFTITKIYTYPSLNGTENVVGKIDWIVTFNKDGIESSGIGSTIIPATSEVLATPLSSLTHEQAIEWIKFAEGGEGFLLGLEQFHARRIDSAIKSAQMTEQSSILPTLNPVTSELEIDLEEELRILNLNKNRLTNNIDRERERRGILPIEFNGSLWDVDEKGLRNIKGWLDTLRFNKTIPAGFVWRDANNIDHPFSTGEELEVTLSGIHAATIYRATGLYQTAWAKKAEVNALTTVPQTIAYDINIGW